MYTELIIGITAIVVMIISIVVWMTYDYKLLVKFGAGKFNSKWEDCKQANEMLVSFILDSMEGKDRQYDETTDAGCDGYHILSESNDCARIIKLVHETGGRLVLRKKSEGDIDTMRGHAEEFKRVKNRLDTARYRKFQKKRRK